ncbi:hypothetical protein MSSAC_0946 [Methanosarcina siciliae C2J]|uniref:Uncharacterized protein n=1 Tax=Methanosarcina siciliae C2J TaxID=1434118 RepID=A0A0E3LCH6_9EURY|nr:hypothetical protein [Methanosarcina siciliae]AKB35536.1 hypothetical protein MSSAC_0946 [Methanosarcina siciliae C2J]
MAQDKRVPPASGSEPPLAQFSDSPMIRLPEVLLVLSPDQVNGERNYPGSVGIKYGPSKDDWVRLPYTTMKKIIDFCKENALLFNSQLQKEREKNLVSDL